MNHTECSRFFSYTRSSAHFPYGRHRAEQLEVLVFECAFRSVHTVHCRVPARACRRVLIGNVRAALESAPFRSLPQCEEPLGEH